MIADGVRNNSMTDDAIKTYAQAFLTIKPFSSIEDAKQKMANYATQFPLFAQLSDYIDAYYSEEHKDELIEQMRQHLKNGNIDQAIQIAKQ